MLRKDELTIDPEKQKEKIIQINRVTKVVTGGKRLAFRAAVVVGDEENIVGVGIGKAREVPLAIRKAIDSAKRNLVKVKNFGGTLAHNIIGNQGASKVLLKPARPGTGIIAGGAVRVVLELAGYRNVVAKSLGSSNAINCAKATIHGLKRIKSEEEESRRRGKKIVIRKISDEAPEEKVEEIEKRKVKGEKEEIKRKKRLTTKSEYQVPNVED